jgi:4-aminobutyrate aminotransferase-like enzyme
VVNTGAEAVENAMKAVLLSRVRAAAGPTSGFFVISFDGAFHGRTLGALAVTQRKRARAGFPTFDWPHVPFPALDPDDLPDTDRREERALREVWELIVTGRLPTVARGREAFRRDLEVVDALLASVPEDLEWRLERARAQVAPEVQQRARRVAGILVEPIQGEGGVRVARPDFFRRLRLLSALYEVPLIFDEVQCGGGITGTRWAHDRFDLPLPPDAVTWAKSAQNGVLFVSEELATFFQEEKKFNTTWEGDSVGMLRLLALLDRLDLDQARRTGQEARRLLAEVMTEHHALVHGLRGDGCMLGFDVARSDLRDAIRERTFRRGLILLPAGERTLRFYPRLDQSEGSLREAVGLLRQAIDDVASGRTSAAISMPERRVGAFDVPRSRQQLSVFDAEGFADLRDQIEAVEEARYGSLREYPPEARSAGVRPLLAYPLSVLAASIGSPGAFGVALRDSVSRRLVGYAIAGALEGFDEEGVSADPHLGEGTVVYLQALATLPSVKNHVELANVILEAVRERAIGLGCRYLSSLIESQVRENGPPWIRAAEPLRTLESYLGSGIRFVYVQVPIAPEVG